jgi:hypothetical protein
MIYVTQRHYERVQAQSRRQLQANIRSSAGSVLVTVGVFSAAFVAFSTLAIILGV